MNPGTRVDHPLLGGSIGTVVQVSPGPDGTPLVVITYLVKGKRRANVVVPLDEVTALPSPIATEA